VGSHVGQRRLPIAYGVYLIPFAHEVVLDYRSEYPVVFDDEDVLVHRQSVAAGSVMRAVVPVPAALSNANVPP